MSKWEWKKLGEVCDSINGLWKGKKEPFIKVGVIRNTNFTKKCKLDLNPNKLEFLDVEKKQYDKRKLQFGDLIVEKSGGSEKQPVGRVVLFEEKEGEYSFSNFTSVLRIKNDDEIECHFLHLQLYKLYLDGVTKQMQSATTGIHNLDFDQFKDLSIGIPPLSEQNRIVKFLDDEFSKIDTLKTNAETNLKNAKELFETTLEKELNPQSRHSERSEESSAEWPSGWEWKKIGDFCETSSGGTHLKQHNKYYENGNIPWLRSGEVCQKEIFETEMCITQKGMENSSAKYFPENSVVVAMYGATAGQVGIVRFRTTTNQAVCGIFPNEKYKTEYLYYALLSKKNELVAQAVGGAQPNISQIKIRSLVVPLPPLSVQKEIVARLDKLSENVKRLEVNYKQIIADCDELKKSILKKTFEEES